VPTFEKGVGTNERFEGLGSNRSICSCHVIHLSKITQRYFT
jgi:hypothetical protein